MNHCSIGSIGKIYATTDFETTGHWRKQRRSGLQGVEKKLEKSNNISNAKKKNYFHDESHLEIMHYMLCFFLCVNVCV